MIHVTISVRALMFVFLLALAGATGSEVARGAPTSAPLLDVDLIAFNGPGVDGARDIRTTDNDGGLRFYIGDNLTNPPQGAAIQFFGNDRNVFNGQAFIDSGAHNNAAIIFRTAGTGQAVAERLRVAANGNVGIGTPNPSQRLDVDFGNVRVQGPNSFSGIGTQATLFLGDTNHYIRSINNSGVRIGTFQVPDAIALEQGTGNVGIGTTAPQARLQVEGNSVVSGSMGVGTATPQATLHVLSGVGSLNLWGQHTGSGVGIAGSSNSGIGVRGESTSGYAGAFEGNVAISGGFYDNAISGTCYFHCPSDARLKKDIASLRPVLPSLMDLRPVRFDWRREEFPELRLSNSPSIGLLAQEVEAVLPELVYEGDKGYKSVRYEQLPVMLLEGVKELKVENGALAADNADLRGTVSEQAQQIVDLQMHNAALEARLASIERWLDGAVVPFAAAR